MRITSWRRPLRTALSGAEVCIELASGRRVRCDGVYRLDNGKLGVGEFLECTPEGSSHGFCPQCLKKLKQAGRKETAVNRRKRCQTAQRLAEIRREPRVERLDYIWQCEWEEQKKRDTEKQRHCASFSPFSTPRQYAAPSMIRDDVLAGNLRGFVFCTLGTRKSAWEKRDHFPQFYTKVNAPAQGPLAKLMEAHNLKLPQSNVKLVSSHRARGWHHTQAIQRHAEILGEDFLMYGVTEVLESRMETVFTETVSRLAEMRCRFTQLEMPVMVMAIKAVSNSTYGASLMDQTALHRVDIVKEPEVLELRNKSTYVDSTPLYNDCLENWREQTSAEERHWEVESTYQKKAMTLPFLVGATVLSLAKTAFSELVWGLYAKYYRAGSFQVCYSGSACSFRSRCKHDAQDLFRSSRHRQRDSGDVCASGK